MNASCRLRPPQHSWLDGFDAGLRRIIILGFDTLGLRRCWLDRQRIKGSAIFAGLGVFKFVKVPFVGHIGKRRFKLLQGLRRWHLICRHYSMR